MKNCLLTILFGIYFIPLFSQITYTGALTNTDPTFNRPDEGLPPTTLSTLGTNVHYNVITVNITTAGLMTFSSNSVWDNFAVLYNSNGLIPSSPLTNSLVANDDFGTQNFGFTYNFTSAGTYYLVICSFKNNVTGAYSITQSAPIVLPLKLTSFTAAKAVGNSNLVKWSSEDESNLNTYQVQRSIGDNSFTDLKNGRIVAKNNTTNTAYSFTDNNPAPGYNYYRLKITETTGRISYSPVALVKNNKPGTTHLKVFPNPSSDYLQIEVKSMQNNKAFVSVINSGGAIMHSGQYGFNNQGVLSLEIRKLPAGKYFLKTTINKEETITIFIKN